MKEKQRKVDSQLNKNFIRKHSNSNLLNKEKNAHNCEKNKVEVKKKSASHGFTKHFLFLVFETLLCSL